MTIILLNNRTEMINGYECLLNPTKKHNKLSIIVTGTSLSKRPIITRRYATKKNFFELSIIL